MADARERVPPRSRGGSFGDVGDEAVGFFDGFGKVVDEAGHIGFDAGGFTLQGGDGAGIQVVLEVEDLVAEDGEDGVDALLGGAHGVEHAIAGFAGVAEFFLAVSAVVGVLVLSDFGFPLLEEVVGDLFDGVDAGFDIIGAAFAAFEHGGEAVVFFLEVAAVEMDDGGELFEGVLEHLLGVLLGVAGFADAGGQEVAFFLPEGGHGFIVDGADEEASGGEGAQQGGGNGGKKKACFHAVHGSGGKREGQWESEK